MKSYMDQHCTDLNDLSHVELMLNADQLPPNQRIMLLNLFEEVTDLLKEKQSEVDSMLQCLDNAEIAYQVSVSSSVMYFMCCFISY